MQQEFIEYKDSFGAIRVRKDRLWGPQTQRSIENFDIYRSRSLMPIEIIHGFSILKKAAALTNQRFGLNSSKAETIVKVCDEILSSKLDDHFPLVVWQTGSGTQSNMNVNEVISIRGQQLTPGISLHPNNDVNMGQSSNDTFPTAMHIALTLLVEQKLIPSLKELIDVFEAKQNEFKDIIKIGRTHTQDATPISLGQEFSGYTYQLKNDLERINKAKTDLLHLALGGTAVGTGLNTFQGFSEQVSEQISTLTNYSFVTASNKFQSLACHDGIVNFHGSLNTLAVSLMKIANDIRFLGSGPRAGLGELKLPQNQQGSSIMPGKVNPTQCEAVTMVCAQVMGNNISITVAGSNGHFELNVFKPVIVKNAIESIHLLSDSMRSFNKHCISGIQPNLVKIQENLDNSLMVITALAPCIGYNLAGQVAKKADKERTTLKESFFSNQNAKKALKSYLNKEMDDEELQKKYKQIINPSLMLQPSVYKQ